MKHLPQKFSIPKWAIFISILIISIIFVYPIVFTPGLWASFDSPFHITMIAQFHTALKHFYVPVVWTDGVANYGLPFGIIAHPFTSYVGALLTFLTQDPLHSYKAVWLIFSFISTYGAFRLFRKYTSTFPALAGSILYTFSAYRILNLYVRGALPEFAGSAWLPFLLYSLFSEKERVNLKSFITLTFWYTLIFFTHPMYLVFSSFMTAVFLIFYRPVIKYWIIIGISIFCAFCMNAFYLIPLNLEVKYFYIGQDNNDLYVTHSGLTFDKFFIEEWEYTCSSGDTPTLRCNRIQTGLIETLLLIIAPLLYWKNSNKKNGKLYSFILFTAFFTTFFVSTLSEQLFEHIKILGALQYQYRFLNVWIILPAFILALALNSLSKNKKILISVSIIGILLLRLPQIYVKNVQEPNRSLYYHNIDNIHSIMMNTIWMDQSKNYKLQPNKGQVISGNATIYNSSISPTQHTFNIKAEETVRLADYTFFFPGWRAYVDGKEVPIEWQDPNHRGYITLEVPAGDHLVKIEFTDTKIRFFSKIISTLSILLYIIIFINYTKRNLIWNNYIPKLK